MTDCAAPRHHGQPEPAEAAPHAYLCRSCTYRLRSDLRQLPSLHAQLADILDPHGTGPGDGDGDGLPYNEPASEAMSQITHDLTWWTAEATAARGWEPPADTRVPAMAGWLHAQVRWISDRDWAPLMAGAFASARHEAFRLLNPRPVAMILIPPDIENRCPECHTPGTLTAVIYQDPADPRTPLVTCGACGHEQDALQWLRRCQQRYTRATEGTAA